MKTGTVFRIQRFSINDGDGIRTVVFLKGCPLNCLWCHNPEGKRFRPEISFDERKCLNCGKCASVCDRGVHSLVEGFRVMNRSFCTVCGKCAAVCHGALEMIGQSMTADQVLFEVIKDRPFYRSTGGMTVSGGEPLAQASFLVELLEKAKKEDLNTCIETSGYASWNVWKRLLPYLDTVLFDVKEMDDALHRKFTGVSNVMILENLRKIDETGIPIVLRCPIIPGCNNREDHLKGIARLANELKCVRRIDVEPYHPLGAQKSKNIGDTYALPELGFPSSEEIEAWIDTIRSETAVQVVRS